MLNLVWLPQHNIRKLKELASRALLQSAFLPGGLKAWTQAQRITDTHYSSASFKSGETYDVELGKRFFLVKQLSVPKKASQNLEAIVSLHVRQSSPNNASDLVWRYVEGARTADKISVQIHLIKKRVLSKLAENVANNGAILRTVTISDTDGVAPLLDFRRETDRLPRWWFLGSVLILVLALFLVDQAERAQTNILSDEFARTESEKRSLTENLVELQIKQEELEHASGLIESDRNLFESEQNRLDVLLALSKLLSDETWISNATFDASVLRVSVFSTKEVSQVMKLIEAQSWVTGVDASGPVSFDTITQQNRFDLTVSLKTAQVIAQ